MCFYNDFFLKFFFFFSSCTLLLPFQSVNNFIIGFPGDADGKEFACNAGDQAVFLC